MKTAGSCTDLEIITGTDGSLIPITMIFLSLFIYLFSSFFFYSEFSVLFFKERELAVL